MRTIKKKKLLLQDCYIGSKEDLRTMTDINALEIVLSALKLGKATFFNTLNPNLSKNIWTVIHYVKKKQCSIPTIVSNNCNLDSDEEKAQVLNNHFSRNFNCSLPPLNPNNFSVPQSIVCPDELLCTEVEVFNLISSIDMTKSNGLDGISARMLKATVGSITLAVTNYQMNGNLPLLPPNQNPAINLILLIYRPISLLAIISKFNLRNSNNIQFKRPICHTNAYMNSFFPHIISI